MLNLISIRIELIQITRRVKGSGKRLIILLEKILVSIRKLLKLKKI